MSPHDFKLLLSRFTLAAETGVGEKFSACFTEDAVYHDYIYGAHKGREAIAHMMQHLFHRDAGEDYRWEMFDPIIDGDLGYAWSLSSWTSTMEEFEGRHVVIDGMSRFRLQNGLIAEYWESVNGGVAMTQLGVAAERQFKVFDRWSGWLRDDEATKAYLARAKGEHANNNIKLLEVENV